MTFLKTFYKGKLLLIFILALSIFLRVWDLGNVPPSASLDEASIGYNAYSVLKTGTDEYGDFPLISQRGYDDFRRSTYLFLTAPFIKILGLNTVAVRLPAVILSILSVWATYYIVLALFFKNSNFSISVALLSVFLLTISPWHIYISRLGHESNAYLSFFIFGLFFLLMGIKREKSFIIFISIIFFLLSMISYYAGQVLIPLFLLVIFMLFKKDFMRIIFSDKKNLIPFFIISGIAITIFLSIFSREAIVRYQGTSILNPDATWQESQIREHQYKKAIKNKDLLGRIYNSEKVYSARLLINGYLSHFNPKWLFIKTGNEPFKTPNLGLLYFWQLPFIILGIVVLIKNRNMILKHKMLIFLWLILSAVPASVATQAPHAMRSYTFVLVWQIFTALGLFYLFNKFKNIRFLLIPLFLIVVLFSLVSLLQNYFINFPKEQSKSFQYGLAQAIPYIISIQNNYDYIVFSNKENLYQSYMFFLFYSRFDPWLYKKEGGTKSGGFAETHRIGKYEFRPIVWKNEIRNKKTLYIGNPSDFPQDINPITEFKNLDGKVAVKIVSKNE